MSIIAGFVLLGVLIQTVAIVLLVRGQRAVNRAALETMKLTTAAVETVEARANKILDSTEAN